MSNPNITLLSKFVIPVFSVVSLAYFFRRTGWDLVELARSSLGMLALWGPLAGLIYLILKQQITDPLVRASFGSIASYTLTTLLFFTLSALQLGFIFYVILGVASVGLLIHLIKSNPFSLAVTGLRAWQRLDWILISLIAISLVTNITYKQPFKTSVVDGTKTYVLSHDHLYHTGQAYELNRNTPPIQASIRAGTPERAYHNFSHVTTMLIGRFTAQPDLLRVHLLYHYTVIEILMCLAFFSLVKTLTGSCWPAYISVALLYPLALNWPMLIPDASFHFYFTAFPHRSSGLDPVALASPQMYSGLLVMFGIFVGVANFSCRNHCKQPISILLFIIAIIIGATIRFRIHVFIVVLPGFLFLMLFLWTRHRHRIYLISGAVAFAIGLGLYVEMQSSTYLSGTSTIRFGYNGISRDIDWVNGWPYSKQIYNWLAGKLSEPIIFTWVWQIISMFSFVTFNMIGLPLTITSIIYFTSRSARQKFASYSFLVLCALSLSVVGAMIVTTDYDAYSVGGQLLLHTRWYVFPLFVVGIWIVFIRFQEKVTWPHSIWLTGFYGIFFLGVLIRLFESPSVLRSVMEDKSIAFTNDEVLMFSYFRENTPESSIVISKKYINDFIVSGLAGRSAYLELPNNPVDKQALRLFPEDDRSVLVNKLWETSDEKEFCSLLLSTPITHVIESVDEPFHVIASPACIKRIWRGPDQEASIWLVETKDHRGSV